MLLDRFIFRNHFHPEERLEYVVHQHWFAAYKPICKIGFFGLVVPAILWYIFPTKVALFIFGIWFIAGFIRFLYEVADWYFDVLLITNRGIIDLDWRGVFDKSSSRVDYETVVGVTYEKKGFWSNILNFGYIEVEKEGHGDERIELPNAANPQKCEREIIRAREKYLRERGMEDEKVLKEILTGMVKSHVRNKREKKETLADII